MRRLMSTLGFAVVLTGAAAAQGFPNKQLTLIVPFAPGGTSDIIARIAADEMGQILNQRVLIENVGGAGGSTGLTRAMAAPPDGYTMVIGNAGTSAATYWIHKGLQFTPDSFKPVGMIAKTMPVIALKNAFPAKDVKGFLDYAKANPGKVTLGHAGVGSSNFLICKLFLQAAKVNVELIGYRGASPALNDAVGGHVDGVCDAATSVAGAINTGKVHGLVMAGKKRLEAMPGVPTAAEAGLPEFTNEGWNALFVPAGTPDGVIKVLNDTLRKALASEKVAKRLTELAAVPASGEELEPAYVKNFVEVEVKKYRELLAN